AVGALPRDDASVRGEHAEHDPHRRRLARAVRAEAPENLAARHVEGESVERDDRAESLVEVVDGEGHDRTIARVPRGRDWADRPGCGWRRFSTSLRTIAATSESPD